jgi:hypothetical protein
LNSTGEEQDPAFKWQINVSKLPPDLASILITPSRLMRYEKPWLSWSFVGRVYVVFRYLLSYVFRT